MFRKILMVVAVLFVLVGCGPSEVRLDANANGTQKEIQRGTVLFITLDSNPTTGYSWQVAPIEPAIVRQVGNAEYKASAAAPGIVGSGGTETFRFEPLSAGTTTLKLNYQRPWEKDVAPIKTFTVQITVR